jgi:hypothetical protein
MNADDATTTPEDGALAGGGEMSTAEGRADFTAAVPGWFAEWVAESGISAEELASFGLDESGRLVDWERARAAISEHEADVRASMDFSEINANLARAQAGAEERTAQRARNQAAQDRAVIDEPVRYDWPPAPAADRSDWPRP